MTASVLYTDIVGFSMLSPAEQRRVLDQLNFLVRELEWFRGHEEQGRAFLRDSGDGVALVFMAPARDVLGCCKALAAQARMKHLELRIGLHTGQLDANILDHHGKTKGTGDAIVNAVRVMDLGDAGHILMTHEFVEALRPDHPEIDQHLHDLGDHSVKHGVVLRVYNYFDGTLGSPQKPQKLGGPSVAKASKGTKTLKVAIAYKRHGINDEHVMKLIKDGLEVAGHQVFIDLNLLMGEEWAAEIRKKIWDSDAIVVLLSERAVGSEMVEAEVLEASEAHQKQEGRPRMLPVRVAFDAPLPPPFAAILDPIQHGRWESPADDARLLDELRRAIEAPEQRLEPLELEPVGGAVPLDSSFYIERPTDAEFIRAVERRDGLVLLKGPRQVGKTSLLSRALQRAREAGERVVTTDFQSLNEADFESVEAFYRGVCSLMLRRMGLRIPSSEYWVDGLDPNANLEYFLAQYVIPESGYLVWGLDEVDRLFGRPYASQVFALFRSWFNLRASDPDQPYARMVMAIAYATEAHLFISDLNQSPFNVGTRLRLDDFSPDQVSELNERYGRVLATPADLMRVYDLLSGQPFLIRRALNELAESGATLNELMQAADRDEGPFGDHLRRILMGLSRDPALAEVCRQLLRKLPCTDGDAFLRLRSAGVLRGDSMAEAQFRCRLYRDFLDRHLR